MLNLVVTAALKKEMVLVLLATRSIGELGETFTEKRRVIKIFCCLAYFFFNVCATIFAQISKDVDQFHTLFEGPHQFEIRFVSASADL